MLPLLRSVAVQTDTSGMFTMFQMTVNSLTQIYNLNIMHIQKWCVLLFFFFLVFFYKLRIFFHNIVPENH